MVLTLKIQTKTRTVRQTNIGLTKQRNGIKHRFIAYPNFSSFWKSHKYVERYGEKTSNEICSYVTMKVLQFNFKLLCLLRKTRLVDHDHTHIYHPNKIFMT